MLKENPVADGEPKLKPPVAAVVVEAAEIVGFDGVAKLNDGAPRKKKKKLEFKKNSGERTSINQSIDEGLHQSIDQGLHQSINQWKAPSNDRSLHVLMAESSPPLTSRSNSQSKPSKRSRSRRGGRVRLRKEAEPRIPGRLGVSRRRRLITKSKLGRLTGT